MDPLISGGGFQRAVDEKVFEFDGFDLETEVVLGAFVDEIMDFAEHIWHQVSLQKNHVLFAFGFLNLKKELSKGFFWKLTGVFVGASEGLDKCSDFFRGSRGFFCCNDGI